MICYSTSFGWLFGRHNISEGENQNCSKRECSWYHQPIWFKSQKVSFKAQSSPNHNSKLFKESKHGKEREEIFSLHLNKHKFSMMLYLMTYDASYIIWVQYNDIWSMSKGTQPSSGLPLWQSQRTETWKTKNPRKLLSLF